jgi:hypothetical protein
MMRAGRSNLAVAVLVAAAIVASVVAAVWVSGFLPVFAANRGLLQVLIVIPVASLVTGSTLGMARVVPPAQMVWGMVLVEVVILIGTGVFGAGYRAWPWVMVMSSTIVIPCVIGMLGGSAIRKRRTRSE